MSHFDLARPMLAKALTAKGYTTLTPVQDAVLDPALDGRDLLVSAQTGSGKTVAFGLAMAPNLLGEGLVLENADSPLALAIAPTRELALQVKRELEWLYRDTGAKMASCVGGMDMRDERRALSRGAHIVVGTPGRLCDHIKRGSLDLSGLKAVVLDEADEMLKMGFQEDLELILGASPEDKRTLMFSATVPKSILGMAKKYQNDAIRVNTAAEAKQHLDIDYRVMVASQSDKENAIINALRYYDAKNAIVFGDTRVAVNRMVSRFNNRGFSVVALSGELSQSQRSAALQALRDGRANVCIATDVAARGLDLPDLELVIHADIPKNREALLHRSGRTGRAGRKGTSVLIVPHKGQRRAERLLRDAKITANWGNPPSAEDVMERDNERLLADAKFTDEIQDDEKDIVAALLAAHSPEQIVAAFVRQYREGRSAPEELTGSSDSYDAPSDRGGRGDRGERKERKPRSRSDFDGSTWFSLNLGRKQKAEPRWILPMLCKSGELKKNEIGAIKISETKTFVEVAPSGVERFIDAIGPQGKIEKAITATRIDGAPDFADESNRPQFKPRDKDSYAKKNKGPKKGPREDGDKPRYNPADEKPSAARGNTNDDYVLQSISDMPEPKGKKPHKKKLARAAALAAKGQSRTGKSAQSANPKSGPKGGGKAKAKSTGRGKPLSKGHSGGPDNRDLKRKPRTKRK